MISLEGRVISFDLGSKRVGVAISDPLGISANPLGFIKGENEENLYLEIKKLIEKYSPVSIVVGVPVNMNGTYGDMAEKSLSFGRKLEEIHSIPVTFIDERLTSMEAENILLKADVSRKKRKKAIDGMAASLILQKYLEMQRGRHNL